MASQKQRERQRARQTQRVRQNGTGGAGGATTRDGRTAAGQKRGPRGAPAAATPGPGQRRGPRDVPAATPATAATAATPHWLRLTTLGLSLAGLAVSIYLTIEHYTGSTSLAACPENSTINCLKVTTSPQSVIFGIFPVAVLGLAFYVFMTAVNTPWAWKSSFRPVWWVRLGSVIVGIIFVLYLIYTELFTVNAICLWCTSVHVITFLLFVLLVAQATIWGQAGGRAPELRG